MMKIDKIKTGDIATKSKLPASDFVINPYVGCPHACKYCYARFMRRFANHSEPWGEFLDVKISDRPLNLKKLTGKSIFLSSVTDCYNKYEKEFGITRGILEQMTDLNAGITISTKSDLILRDMDILKRLKNLTVAFSINTLDEDFRKDMDKASPIKDRLAALGALYDNGIRTVLFMSPIFPHITDFAEIIEATRDYVRRYWFENLNLRGGYKGVILDYIKTKRPDLYGEYLDIFCGGKGDDYWNDLEKSIAGYCAENGVAFDMFFHHDRIRKK